MALTFPLFMYKHIFYQNKNILHIALFYLYTFIHGSPLFSFLYYWNWNTPYPSMQCRDHLLQHAFEDYASFEPQALVSINDYLAFSNYLPVFRPVCLCMHVWFVYLSSHIFYLSKIKNNNNYVYCVLSICYEESYAFTCFNTLNYHNLSFIAYCESHFMDVENEAYKFGNLL